MLNSSAVLTDRSTWLTSHFRDGEQLFFYDGTRDRLQTLPDQVSSLLSSEDRIRRVAAAGKKEAFLRHTWEKRCETLLKILNPLS